MSHQNLRALSAATHKRRTIPAIAPLAITITLIATLLLTPTITLAISTSEETIDSTFPASVNASGEFANKNGETVSISNNGRYVAFASAADNLGEHGLVGVEEAYVKDLDTGEVKLVSRASGASGEPANEPGEAYGVEDVMISGNGEYVIFASKASNLVSGLPAPEEAREYAEHIYRRDLETGETVLVDRVTGAEGTILDERTPRPVGISDEGRYVLFNDHVEDLENPAGTHETGTQTVYVRDMQTGTTTAVSRASGTQGELANESSWGGSIAPDGDYVAFESAATNLVEEMGSNTSTQVYVRDLQSGTTTLVSKSAPTGSAPNGEPGDKSSEQAVLIGESGCEVAYESLATNLYQYEDKPLTGPQIYLTNYCSSPATTTLISRATGQDGAPAETGGETPVVLSASANGQKVVFYATLDASGTGTEATRHLYVRDLQTEQTTLIDRASGVEGAIADNQPTSGAISGNGCRVAFASRAENLAEQMPPESAAEETYVRQLAPCREKPSITPENVSFPAQPLHTVSPTQEITLTAGSEALAVHSLQLAGPDAPDFLVTADECSKETLEPGQTCTFIVRFVPGATGPLSASLTIHTEPAVGLELSLSGEGGQLPTGERGPAGVQGATGEQGSPGPTGLQGSTGAQGSSGAQGPVSPRGKTGPRGPGGVDTKVTCRFKNHSKRVKCRVILHRKKAKPHHPSRVAKKRPGARAGHTRKAARDGG
jgi:hypothetical protein